MALQMTLVAIVAPASWAAPGDLDLTFSGDGTTSTPVGTGEDSGELYGIAVQADGKIVVTGYATSGGNQDFAVVRYNADGSLDPSFDGDGRVSTPIGTGTDYAHGVAMQPDGKIVVCGYSSNGSNRDIALVRYNGDGSLDASFDGDGKVRTPVGPGDDYAFGIAVQPDGKIIVSGYAWNGSNYDFALVRYNANGSLDTSFDGDGKVVTPIGESDDLAYGMDLQADGHIVVTGLSKGSTFDVAVARYNSDGSLDAAFGGSGKVTTPVGPYDDVGYCVASQTDGKVVVSGYTSNGNNFDLTVLRFNVDGSLDTSFDGDGKTVTPIGDGYDDGFDIAIQQNGKIVIAGTAAFAPGPNHGIVARFTESGALDPTFHGGYVVVPIQAGYSDFRAVALQPDGKIVVSGYTSDGTNGDFGVARFVGDAVCGDSIVEPGEECDDGNRSNGDCCSSACHFEIGGSACSDDGEFCTVDTCNGAGECLHTAGNAGVVCRGAAGGCDVVEVCDGSSPICPSDVVQPQGTSCRSTSGVCDAEERCDGVISVCPSDMVLPAGSICRPAAGPCDLVEGCDGSSDTCPPDAKSSEICRPIADACDLSESCNGVDNDCPMDAFVPAGTLCRGKTGACDVAESCSGDSATCPPDEKEINGATCNDADPCTQIDTCENGSCVGSGQINCDDGNACTSDSCTAGAGCVNEDAPAQGCLTAAHSRLLIESSSISDDHDRLSWFWRMGAPFTKADLGDPTGGEGYALCVYAGAQPEAITVAALPPGSGWSPIGDRGFKFRGGNAGPLSLALIKGGAAGKSKALAKGRGTALPDVVLPLPYPVRVQLRKDGTPLCLESIFTTADEKRNSSTRFSAKR